MVEKGLYFIGWACNLYHARLDLNWDLSQMVFVNNGPHVLNYGSSKFDAVIQKNVFDIKNVKGLSALKKFSNRFWLK